MAQVRPPISIDEATRNVVTRSLLANTNSISRFKACEATRDLQDLVNNILLEDDDYEEDDGSSSLYTGSAGTFFNFADSGSERSYGTELTTPDMTPKNSPVKSRTVDKTLNRRSQSISDFRYQPLEPFSPTTHTTKVILLQEKPLPSIVPNDPFAASGDSFFHNSNKSTNETTPRPAGFTRSTSTTSRRWLPGMKRSPSTSPSSPSQPPTSFPRSASSYASSLTRGRNGTGGSMKSSKISAPSFMSRTSSRITTSSSPSSGLPGQRRRTSSLTSIDKVFAEAGETIASTLKRALHLRSSSKVSPFPFSRSFDTSSTRANSSVRAQSRSRSPSPTPYTSSLNGGFQFPEAIGAPPSIPLPFLPPPPSLIPFAPSLSSRSILSSHSSLKQTSSRENTRSRSSSSSSSSLSLSFSSSANSEIDQKGDKNLPGVPVGRDRDLLMWRTEEMDNRRAAFVCTMENDLAALRLRTEDDDDEFLSWEQFGRFLDVGGKEAIGSVLVQSRSQVQTGDRSQHPLRHAPVELTRDLHYRLGRLDDLARIEQQEIGLDSFNRRSRRLSWIG